jgi:hypothetical protein
MTDVELALNMSENWTIWDPRDARVHVDVVSKATSIDREHT